MFYFAMHDKKEGEGFLAVLRFFVLLNYFKVLNEKKTLFCRAKSLSKLVSKISIEQMFIVHISPKMKCQKIPLIMYTKSYIPLYIVQICIFRRAVETKHE